MDGALWLGLCPFTDRLGENLHTENLFLIVWPLSGRTDAQDVLNRKVVKSTFGHVRPAKNQISLRIRAVWSESSLGAFWIAKDATFLHAGSEDSDQTAHISEGTLSDVSVHLDFLCIDIQWTLVTTTTFVPNDFAVIQNT